MKNQQLVLSCYCSTITLLFISPAMQSHGCSVQVEHLFSFSTFGFLLLFGSVKKKQIWLCVEYKTFSFYLPFS